MSEQLITSIDIGSSKIATLVAFQSEEKETLPIIGFNSVPSKGVKKGLIVDIEKATSALNSSIEKAERMAGHKINDVFVSIGGPHITSLNSRGVVAVSNPKGEIVEEDLKRVIEAARAISLSGTKEIIDVSARDYIVNGQAGIKNPLGMTGIRLEVETHIITASQTNLKNIDRCLSLLGVKNEGFIFSGLASAEAVLTETEKELGIILADIGGGKIDVVIYVDGALSYSLSIPIGARHITNDIAVGLRVSLESAEKIKVFLSSQFNKKNKPQKKDDIIDISSLHIPEEISEVSYKTVVDGIITPRLEEIFKMIFEEIEKSGLETELPSGLVITGGGAMTINILNVGKRVLGVPIRIGKPKGVSGLVDEVLYPQFATVVGLILSGGKHIIDSDGWKDFGSIFKEFSFIDSVSKMKSFFKQFIP